MKLTKKIANRLIFALCVIASVTIGFSHSVKAVDYQQKEMNSTFSDSLEEAKSVNRYAYKTTEDGYLTISFIPETESRYGWNMKLLDSNYQELTSWKGIKNNYVTRKLTFEKNSQFYIEVEGYYHDKDAPVGIRYDLSVNHVNDSEWEVEANNTFGKANSLKSGVEKRGSLWLKSDVDYYKFKVTKTGYTVFKFVPDQEHTYGWKITYYDGQGNVLYQYAPIKTNYTSRIFNLKKGSTIYFSIEGYYHDNHAPVGIEYTISAVEKATNTWESEPNDTSKKATTISGSKYGTLYLNSDVDVYKYKAKTAGKKKIKFSIEDDVNVTYGWRIKVYEGNIDSSKLVASLNQVKNDTTLKFKAKKGKNYFVVIEGYYHDNDAPTTVKYKITLK